MHIFITHVQLFKKQPLLISQVRAPFCSCRQGTRVLELHFSPALGVVSLTLSHSDAGAEGVHRVSICSSQMTNDFGHLFMDFTAMHVSSSVKYQLKSFVHF